MQVNDNKWISRESCPFRAKMLNMFDMWNSVTTKLEAQSNVQQSQQPHTSGGSIKGNFAFIGNNLVGISYPTVIFRIVYVVPRKVYFKMIFSCRKTLWSFILPFETYNLLSALSVSLPQLLITCEGFPYRSTQLPHLKFSITFSVTFSKPNPEHHKI